MKKTKTLMFDFDRSTLSDKENKMVDTLIELGEIVHEIWDKQVKPDGTSTFYPEDLTKEELLEAAVDSPDLLDPYRVVRRVDGKLVSVCYCDEYREENDRMLKLIDKAMKEGTSFGSKFRRYLRGVSKAIESNDWDRALIMYLTNSDSKFEILIGPIESYNDKLMGVKKSFQYNLRVRRDGDMEEVARLSEAIESAPILKPYLSVTNRSKSARIKIRIDDAIMFAGRLVGAREASTNLPNEPELAEKYGTKVVVYANSMDLKFETMFTPFLKHIKGVDFDLESKPMSYATKRLIVLHELTEGLVKFQGMQKRLENNYDAIREFNAYMLGAKSAEVHLLNGYLTTQEFYEIYIMLLVVGLDKFSRRADSSVMEYARGFAVLYNYLVETKAIKIKDKNIHIDTDRLVAGISSMASVGIDLLHEGTYESSEKLFEQYGDLSITKKLPLKKY